MTILTMEGSGTPARRHAARRNSPVVRRSNVPAFVPLPPPLTQRAPVTEHESRATRKAWGEIGVAALLILALHAGFVLVARHGHVAPPVPVVPPKPLPMTVELTRPPVPLPQAKQVPPPVPQPVKQPPQPPRPLTRAPAPKPLPALTPLATPPAQAATPADTAVAHIPAPAAPAPAAPSAPVAETAPIGNAAYLHNPAPDYPPAAQDQGWEGRVLLRVHVLANGKPDSVDISTSSGRKMLDAAALAAVRRWSFVPAKRGDEAVDGWVNVPIDFKLG
ncbi:energy transducer TonB [Paraburkholderia caffeinilytica]|uniref:energy transducer TonB n=1 Tax=Paraburkholderia caffeinilytica TaxID=1761016 RepID=UPI0038B98EE5